MSINCTIAVGRLTKDATIKMAGTTKLAEFTLAVDRYTKDGNKTDFIPCKAFGKTAEFVEGYIKKGYRVGVNGSIQTGSYQDKDGKTVHTVSVACSNVENLEPRANTSQNTNNATNGLESQIADDDYTTTLRYWK